MQFPNSPTEAVVKMELIIEGDRNDVFVVADGVRIAKRGLPGFL